MIQLNRISTGEIIWVNPRYIVTIESADLSAGSIITLNTLDGDNCYIGVRQPPAEIVAQISHPLVVVGSPTHA